VLGHIRALTADLDRCVATCSTKLDLPLASEGVRRLYHAEDLSEVAVPPEALETLTRLVPEVTALYARLEETADFPGGGVSRPLTAQPQPQRTAVAEAGTNTVGGHEVLACLARVDLETVLHGKDSLDVIRRDHIRALDAQHALTQARVIEVAEHNAALRAEVARLERWRADLQADLGLAQERLLAATAQAAKAETRAGELAERLATSEAEAAASRARADKLETSTTLLAQERDDTERLLAAILRTRAWRAAQKWYAVKQMALRLLAPNTPAGAARTNGGGVPPAAAGAAVSPDAERPHRASRPPSE
jgi:hypothetical protein